MLEDGTPLIQRAYEEIWVDGNIDLFDSFLDLDIVRHNPPFPDIVGLTAYKAYVREVRGAMVNIAITMEDVMLEGELGSARVTLTFTHVAEMRGLQIPATGRQVTLAMGIFSRWQGERIVEEWAYIDYLGLLQQLGVLPATLG